MKKSKMVVIVLIVLLIGSNYTWFRLLKKEQEKLTHAIIPTLTNDYFSTQIALTKNMQVYQMEIDPEKSFENNNFSFDIPLINQNPDYPNGCEAASATMLLNYYGIPITLKDFIENYLMTENVYEKEGKRYGPNPSIYYAGDPSDPKRGWGCFEPVIARAIQSVVNNHKKNDPNFTLSLIHNDLKLPLSEYTNFQVPTIIWTTTDYEVVEEIYEWFSYDGKYTYTYPKNSHAVVITGKDETYYYINDPLKNQKNIPIEHEKLEKSFDSMGRQIIQLDSNNYDFDGFLEK